MSEQNHVPVEPREPAEQVERPLPADELRRRQQLGQTPGMFVEPTAGAAVDPDADKGVERDEAG